MTTTRDPLAVMKSAAFELRTVTTGNEGRVARELDEAIAQVEALVLAARGIADNFIIAETADGRAVVEALTPFTPTDSEGGGND